MYQGGLVPQHRYWLPLLPKREPLVTVAPGVFRPDFLFSLSKRLSVQAASLVALSPEALSGKLMEWAGEVR